MKWRWRIIVGLAVGAILYNAALWLTPAHCEYDDVEIYRQNFQDGTLTVTVLNTGSVHLKNVSVTAGEKTGYLEIPPKSGGKVRMSGYETMPTETTIGFPDCEGII